MTPCTLTPDQDEKLNVARVAFMEEAPFYAHYFYAECREVYTRDIPAAATDGRTIFINPDYVCDLPVQQRVFVYAHEMDHVVCRDVLRAKHYERAGDIKGVPYDQQGWNTALDYRTNHGLIESGIGQMNPSWLYDRRFTVDDLPEDIYGKLPSQPKTAGGSGKGAKGAKGDKRADAAGGSFDTLLDPPVDPVTGETDLPDESAHKEAVARAAGAAKAMGKLPAGLARKIEAILQPQIDWREHIRMLMTGKIGARHETWDRLNRRRLVLNPIVLTPGRKGYGAELVVVAADTSGSVSDAELSAYFAEVSGILADVKPRTVIVIGCDAAVNSVHECAGGEDLDLVREKGLGGGGGTSFIPVFEHIEREQLRPEALVYLTDMMGSFPSQPPGYPVVWAATTDHKPPFGDVVRLKV